jgi:hypothetical protein
MTTRRTSIVLATSLGLATILVVSSCTATDDEPSTASTSASSTPSATPGPAPTAAASDPAGTRPDIPLTTARLTPAPAVIPPVRVVLSGHDIDVPVDPVGVQPDGQMEIPPLAERAGWYRYGSTPRDASGTTLVAAHVDSVASAGLGPFARLTDVAAGDPVDVTLADGSTVRYVVTAVERIDKAQVPWPDVFARDGPPRLVLVTCGGQFLRDRASYSDNVLVTAEPVVG